MISYQETLDGVTADRLQGFFVGWPDPPSAATLLRVLQGSTHIVLARDDETGQVVGYITAVTDGVLAAYIPHLEVRPDLQGRGIGSELVRMMLARLRSIYMVDLICDPELQPYYERLGMRPWTGMIVRNYDRQSGEPPA